MALSSHPLWEHCIGAVIYTQLGKGPVGDRWVDRNAWIWGGVIPALVAWLALHIYI